MNFISIAHAQTAAPAAAPASSGSPLGMFIPFISVIVIMYFLIIRPQQKQQKVRQQMLANLKRGDEVVTAGGIYGKITDLQDTFVMVQVAANVTLKVDRAQISAVTNNTAVKLEPAKS